MTDHAVQTLRQAAAGWRELGGYLDEIIRTLDREVSRARSAHWSGSGAEGFDEQWVRLRGAVEEVLPGFAAAAADLEAAADAASAALEAERAEQENDDGVHSFDDEDALFGGDLSGDLGGGEPTGGTTGGTGSEAGSTSHPSPSADPSPSAGGSDLASSVGPPQGDDTLAQLDAVLRAANGRDEADGDTPSAPGAGTDAGPNVSSSQTSSALESRVGGEPDGERTGAGAGAAPVPSAMGTAAVVAALSQFAATLSDVFTSPAGAAPDASETATPPGASAVRPSDVPHGGAPEADSPQKARPSQPSQPNPPGGAFG